MLRDVTADQRQLANFMSDLSEQAYCAGWMEGLEYAPPDRDQEDLSTCDTATGVLVARYNRLEDLGALVPRLLEVLPSAAHRAVTLVQGQWERAAGR